MSEKSVKKSKGKAASGQQSFSSSITQIVCFAIVATAAVFAFVQARRALYRAGDSLTVSAGDKSSKQSAAEDVEVNGGIIESDNGSASSDLTGDSPSSTDEGVSSSSEESRTKKNAAEIVKTYSDCMVTITATPVNVRSGAGSNYKVIEKTGRGKTFTLLASKIKQDGKEWYQIALPGKKRGWILSTCCRILDENEMKTTSSTEKRTSTTTTRSTTTRSTTTRSTTAVAEDGWVEIKVTPVNIRSGAGAKYKVIRRTKAGKTFKLLSSKKDEEGAIWYEVALDKGKTGWVKSSFCKLKDTEETTSTTTKSTTAKSTTAKSTTSTTTTTAGRTSLTVSTTATTAAVTTATSATQAEDSLIMKLQPSSRKAK